MTRPSKALIDLAALRSNYLTARNLHGGRALAVVKANAYGHGAVPCAQALADIADGFAVAFAAEAFELREAGITKPILVLEGCFDPDELVAAYKANLWVVIKSHNYVRLKLRPLMLTACVYGSRSIQACIALGLRSKLCKAPTNVLKPAPRSPRSLS